LLHESSSSYGRGLALALAGVVLISFEALILRLVGVDVWTLIFWRGLMLSIAVPIALFALNRTVIDPRALPFPAIIAIISSAGCVFTFVGAVKLTTAANTLVIASASPAFAALFSWLVLGERLSRATAVAVTALFGAVAMIVSGSLSTDHLAGDFFALAYAAWLAGYFVALRSCRDGDLFCVVALGGLLSAILAAPMASPLSVTVTDLGFLLGLGALILPVSTLLLAFGTRYLPAPDIVLIMMLEAVLGPLWVWMILNEVPSGYTIMGGAVILATVTIHARAEMANGRLATSR
jgi:drug/metabolite transporter (DMT)-like permease